MKAIKLMSFFIILLGSVMSGSVWAAARSGVGHNIGNDHNTAESMLPAGGLQVNSGQPYVNKLQIARRGGRAFRGGRWYRGNRWFRGSRGFRNGSRWYWGSRRFRGGVRGFYKRGFYGRGYYGRGFGRHYHYGPGISYGVPYYSPYFYDW